MPASAVRRAEPDSTGLYGGVSASAGAGDVPPPFVQGASPWALASPAGRGPRAGVGPPATPALAGRLSPALRADVPLPVAACPRPASAPSSPSCSRPCSIGFPVMVLASWPARALTRGRR